RAAYPGAHHVTFQLPWSSTHLFWGQTHPPCTSDTPTLYLLQLQTAATARREAAARRAVYRCDVLVEARRLVRPNRWWGLWLARCTCWVSIFRNSTDDCLSCQTDHRPRGFSSFSHLPGSRIDLPCTKLHQTSPTLEQNR